MTRWESDFGHGCWREDADPATYSCYALNDAGQPDRTIYAGFDRLTRDQLAAYMRDRHVEVVCEDAGTC